MKKFIQAFLFVTLIMIAFSGISTYAKEFTRDCATSVKASHILVDSNAEATAIKSKIDNGASFEAMAMKYSKCPSGKEGGDLGYFERGQMVKEFENAAFTLPIGKVSDPIKTQFGWHLIKVYDRK